MKLVLILLLATTFLEFFSYIKAFWPYRKVVASIAFSGTLAGTALYVTEELRIFSLLVIIVALYRLFNLFRLIGGLSIPERLRHTAFRTSLWLTMLFYYLILAETELSLKLDRANIYLGSSVVLLTVALICIRALSVSSRRMVIPTLATTHAGRDLPSITIAIPARNETTDLEECLKTLTASTYPKLEIIILDDCSQNRRTPEIIRQFAHDGVRFLSGKPAPEPWLAKNYAYQQLLEEANGEYIIFCGVDTRFEPHAINRLVEGLVQSNKKMISLMPINHVSRGTVLPYLIQPVRYAWEIALPRRWSVRPPVLSTCWIASKDFLKAQGGFASFKQTIVPERHFARRAVQEDSYGFYRADASVGLHCVKSGPAQLSTAIRTRYPIIKRAPENVMLLSLFELALITSPGLLIIYGSRHDHFELVIINALTIAVLSVMYALIDKIAYEQWKLFSFIAMPIALVFDVVVIHISMCKYEFSEVLWKGRNICLPMLEAIPRFPKLPTSEH